MTALLFADFEFTSLDIDHATLLEGAWCIADLDGIQRTPLRHRYLMVAPEDGLEVHPRRGSGLGGGPGWWPADWSAPYANPEALRMAEASGLHEDWLSPHAVPLARAGDLERLILDDLLSVWDRGDDEPDAERGRAAEKVHICGAGAARVDFSILQKYCPAVVPAAGGGIYPVHYRPVDTSGNQTGLLGSNYETEMIAWYLRKHGDADTHSLGENLGIEVGGWPTFGYQRGNVMEWLTDDKHRHRAVPDVVRALIVQRALWHFAAPLRTALSVPVDIAESEHDRYLRLMWRAGRGR